MTKSPSDIFFEWLAAQADHARMAVAVDVDRLLAEAGLLNNATITDSNGRAWRLVVFQGNDVGFRWAYREARPAGRVLVVLARGTAAGTKIDVSYVADILAANEAGAPLDVSLPAFFRRLSPKINFPLAELRRFKDALLERVDAVPKATEKIVQRWRRPDDWGRGQVAALVLLCRHTDWVLDEIWPDQIDPVAAVAHGLRVLLSASGESADLPIMREMLHEAVQPTVKDHCHWFGLPVEQAAAYLLLRAFAVDAKLQNPAIQLAGLQVFPLGVPLEKLEVLAPQVIACLRGDANAWALVEQRAEAFLTPSRCERLVGILPATVTADSVRMLGAPSLLFPHLRRGLMRFVAQPASGLVWADALRGHPVLEAGDLDSSVRRRQCRAAAGLVLGIESIEKRLQMAVPAFAHADDLLDWYIGSGHHGLELDAARAAHDLQGCEDDLLIEAMRAYLYETGDETAPAAGSLGFRIRARLDELDRRLADFVAADPNKFGNGPRSVVGFLRDELKNVLPPILTGDSDSRVWVLIFDGMRFDTWETVLQPLLAEHFLPSGGPRFCVLPSYTQYARTSLLAGALPVVWAAEKPPSSPNETALFAANIGLAAHEVKQKLRLLSDAETDKARATLGFSDKSVKPVNVLIYPISDTCHDYRGDLAAFNSKIRQTIVGDRWSGMRGVLDDLLRRIKPGDIVLATSDHGFVELPPDMAVVVSKAEAASHGAALADTVFYRYATSFQPAQATTVALTAGSEEHHLCMGRQWLRREGPGTSARYSHGGLTLSEVVVPAFRLERVTEKFVAVELTGFAPEVSVQEDQDAEVTFAVRNKGNSAAEFQVVARTNMGDEVLKHSGSLTPAGSKPLKFSVHGNYRASATGETDPAGTLRAVEFRLRHTDPSGNWRDAVDGTVNLPVRVEAKKTKLETDALAGFDEV
jgi:hypothetical protein